MSSFLLEALGSQLSRYLEFYGTEEDLELAQDVVYEIRRRGDTDKIAQAWFQGMNPAIGDVSPARFIIRKDMDRQTKWRYLLYAIDQLG